MRSHSPLVVPTAACLLLAACSNTSGGAGPAPQPARLAVTASTTELEPSTGPFTFDPATVATPVTGR